MEEVEQKKGGGARWGARLILSAVLFLMACSNSEVNRSGPVLPLKWQCEEGLTAVIEGPTAAEQRGPMDSFFEPSPNERIEQVAENLLRQGDPAGALEVLRFGGSEEGRERIRYLRAWALAERARQTCSLPDALEALVEVSELPPDPEITALTAGLEELTGLAKTGHSPWPEVLENVLNETRQGFLAERLETERVRENLRLSLWFTRERSERDFLAEYVAALAAPDRAGSAGRQRAFLDLVASELEGKDPVLREILLALDGIDFGDRRLASSLAEAFHAFSAGTRAYEAQELNKAETLLASTVPVFERHGIPLAHWARFYAAIGKSYDDSATGLAVFDGLAELAESKGYRALAGRALWLASTTRLVRNEFDSAVNGYLRAREFLVAAGGQDAAAFSDVLIAEAETRRGNDYDAWIHRRQAFAEVPRKESLRRQIAMYWEAATALERSGRGKAAGPLHREAVALARRWGQPLGVSISLHGEAMWLLDQGQADEALRRLVEAESWLEQMEESTLKEERRRSQKAYLGRVFGVLDPPRGEVLLREGLAEHRQAGRSFELIDETHHHAKVLLRLGRVSEAIAVLEKGLADFESAHAAADQPATRAALLAEARQVGDLLVQELFDQGKQQEALAVAEQLKRHRYERMQSRNPCAPGDWLVATEQAWLSSYTAPAKTYFWLSRGAELVASLAVPSAELEKRLGRLEQLASKSARKEVDPLLSELNDWVGRPLGLDQLDELVYLPDRRTLNLPLGALFDAQKGRYLIEGTTIRLAAGFGARGKTEGVFRPRSALLVGVSGADVSRGLGGLDKTEAEVQSLSLELGNQAVVLAGAAITPEEIFGALARKPAIFHFAGHAVQNRVLPWESFLSLGERGEILTLGRMRELDLSGLELAVLSACSSLDGLGEQKDAAFGLAGAIVEGGARSVLASSVAVNDKRARRFMKPFYRAYLAAEGTDPAEALRAAALELIGHEKTIPGDWIFWNVLERIEVEEVAENRRQRR